MIQTQIELERSSFYFSRERIRTQFEQKESKGRANETAYAQPLYRRYVLPLQEMIETTLKESLSRAGRRQAHVALLKPLDPLTSAFIATRMTMVAVAEGRDITARQLASSIGRGLHRELILSVYEDIAPNLFYEVMNDLDRRHSRAENHRFNALMGAAQNKGVTGFPRWQQQDREQLGMWFVEALRVLGLIDVQRIREFHLSRIKEVLAVSFTFEATRVMSRVKELVELNTPIHMPCVEPPKDWVAFDDGGWHTLDMRRRMPHCVNIRRVHSVDLLDHIRASDLGKHVLPAINQLQRVKWAINRDMLDAVRDIARSRLDLKEALSEEGPTAPLRPEWLEPKGSEQVLTPEQEDAFKAWKRAMARWHTELKLRGQRWNRFELATKVADKFKEYPAIYFVYQADFRGRMYAQTVGVNPQGSDIQKALLRFAEGKPLDTPEAVNWFKINGANRFGQDKKPFAVRTKWVDDNDRFIIGFADDPVSNDGWAEADQPLQFLAWAKEYATWRRSPGTFLSYIPVGLDGSCNGLQHFSAMLRDPIGGKATNLIGGKEPNDIYAQVAAVTHGKLTAMSPADLPERDVVLRQLWLKHGISRSLVKKSVMTLPYGSTRFSCAEYLSKEYLRHGASSEFEPGQYMAAANFLSHIIWESIPEVVVAAPKAMAWLQSCARTILNDGHEYIHWVTPSGFPVTQVYNKRDEIRINAKLFGGCRLWVHKDKDEPKSSDHRNGLAPNFVHSMDASHMTLTINACEAAGINSLAMIHDDYGTHAADTERLYGLIRSTFADMYQNHDPIMDFFNRYQHLPDPPSRGDLDIREVIRSPFFFA